MKGSEYNRFREKQLERFTNQVVSILFDNKSIPEEKLILDKVNEALLSLRGDVDGILYSQSMLYSKQYILTDAFVQDFSDITAQNSYYDNNNSCYTFSGQISIIVPHTSSYYLYLALKDVGSATYITANNVQYPVQREMKIRFDDTSVISFTSDNYIWLTEIAITEYKLPDIPTKLSQLENDQRFVASNVKEETETLLLTIKEKQE